MEARQRRRFRCERGVSLAWLRSTEQRWLHYLHRTTRKQHRRVQSAYLVDPDGRLKAPGGEERGGRRGDSSTRGACRRLAFRSAPFWKLRGGGLVW